MQACPRCQAQSSAGSRFCGICGAPLQLAPETVPDWVEPKQIMGGTTVRGLRSPDPPLSADSRTLPLGRPANAAALAGDSDDPPPPHCGEDPHCWPRSARTGSGAPYAERRPELRGTRNASLDHTIMGARPPQAQDLAPRALRPPAPAPGALSSEQMIVRGSIPRSRSPHERGGREPVTPLPLPLKLALLILGAALLGAILALVLPRATVRVTEFRVNANGLDELVLSCTDCPDGTRLRHGASEALFFGGQAKLLTARRLSVGENELEVALIEPGERASGMHLHVPVAFRVEVDLSGISAPTPFAEVIVQAEPGARVSVSGQEVPLLDGRARYRLELSEEATGSSSRLRKVSREVPVSVSSDNEVRRTQARMTAPITPLALEAQGALVDPGALYGRSAAGARIEVVQAGRSLGMARADAEGRFEVPLPTPGPEDLLVSASLDGHVTRQVRLPANTKL